MKLNKKTEARLKSIVIKYLKKEGPSFDVPHTKSSVNWMKRLLKKEKGNAKILVSVMYLHDIGYYGLLEDNKSLDKRIKAKKQHMRRGAELSRKILKQLGGFSVGEIRTIANLINTHDILDRKRNPNEQLVFEADGLAMIDKKIPITISKKEYNRFLDVFRRRRIPDFKTKSGKRFLSKFINIL